MKQIFLFVLLIFSSPVFAYEFAEFRSHDYYEKTPFIENGITYQYTDYKKLYPETLIASREGVELFRIDLRKFIKYPGEHLTDGVFENDNHIMLSFSNLYGASGRIVFYNLAKKTFNVVETEGGAGGAMGRVGSRFFVGVDHHSWDLNRHIEKLVDLDLGQVIATYDVTDFSYVPPFSIKGIPAFFRAFFVCTGELEDPEYPDSCMKGHTAIRRSDKDLGTVSELNLPEKWPGWSRMEAFPNGFQGTLRGDGKSMATIGLDLHEGKILWLHEGHEEFARYAVQGNDYILAGAETDDGYEYTFMRVEKNLSKILWSQPLPFLTNPRLDDLEFSNFNVGAGILKFDFSWKLNGHSVRYCKAQAEINNVDGTVLTMTSSNPVCLEVL